MLNGLNHRWRYRLFSRSPTHQWNANSLTDKIVTELRPFIVKTIRNEFEKRSQITKPATTTKQTTQVVKDVENDCKTTSYNDDGSPASGRGQQCIFPFMVYVEEEKQYRTFDRCTTDLCDSDLYDCSKSWCSTQVDENGIHAEGKGNWGYCSGECLPKTTSNLVIRNN